MAKLIGNGLIIEDLILEIRGQRVMIDADLATLYNTDTRSLNQAVKRNITRFPKDFMFQLTKQEKEDITNCDILQKVKFSRTLPYVFTEHGALMLASVINSDVAIQISIEIIHAFSRMHKILACHEELSQKINKIEAKLISHDKKFKAVFIALKKLILFDENCKNTKVGFQI
ncbi:MAG: ORF6N domain-containing protein [Cyanobacteria bacterium]|nr:ORF6N domain-containing protein [Cyanobacteriota bacterium]